MHTLPHFFRFFLGFASRRLFGYALATCVLAIALAGCGASSNSEEAAPQEQDEPASTERYLLRGKVLGLRAEDKSAIINHEEITGWMDAMTMGFPVKDDAEWAKLQVGADIEATVFVDDTGFYIGEIKVIESPPNVSEQK